MEWAKEEILKETNLYNKQKGKISVSFSPLARIPVGEERFFNVGYLFLHKICSKIRLDNICRNICSRHKFKYDIYAILTGLVYARILSPATKLISSYQQKYVHAKLKEARSLLLIPVQNAHTKYKSFLSRLKTAQKASVFII